jgi:hypothetical protein
MSTKRLDVEHLFHLHLQVGDTPNAVIRNGPAGHRFIAEVAGGTFEGDRLTGTVVPPGGDWVHSRADRTAHLDVRLLLVTDDGASILMTYQGIGVPDEERVLHLRTAPTFETGDERYAWLNSVQAVGVGTSAGGQVDYEVYRLL